MVAIGVLVSMGMHLGAAAVSPSYVIHAATIAHRGLHSGEMHFELRSKVGTTTTVLKGDIQLRSNGTLLYGVEDLAQDQRSSRVYKVAGSQVTGYDNYSDEVIRRSAPLAKAPPSRAAFVFGRAVPDPVAAIGDPNWVAMFLAGLSKSGKLKVVNNNGGLVLRKGGPGPKDVMKLMFNKRNLLTSVLGVQGKNLFSWNISYAGKQGSLDIPAGGAVVSAFHFHRPLPKFADAQARQISLNLLRASRRLKPSEIIVKRPDGDTILFWNQGRVREVGNRRSWAYDGKKLTLIVGNKCYQGKASNADALDYLAFLAKGEESLSRSFLLKTNPFDDFFDPNSVVTVKGTMVDQGIPSTILQIQGPATRSSLIFKNSSYVVENASTDTLNAGGHVVSHDEATFKYLPLPSSGTLFKLQIPRHAKLEQFPKSAIHMGRYSDYKTQYVGRPGHT